MAIMPVAASGRCCFKMLKFLLYFENNSVKQAGHPFECGCVNRILLAVRLPRIIYLQNLQP